VSGHRPRMLILLAALALALGAAACGSGSTEEPAACSVVARYDGRSYAPVRVAVAPPAGAPLATVTVARCDEDAAAGTQQITLARLPGVSPQVALAVPSWDDRLLLARGAQLPASAQRLLHAPTCRAEDAPLTVQGPWLSLHKVGSSAKGTLNPPYAVDLRVASASADRYLGALLTVTVPASLGRPLEYHDLHKSLLRGGTITITALCDGDTFVAQRLHSDPPRTATIS
jgi:uncharacterized protein DUF6281